MTVQKNFVIRNGIEVNENLVVANSSTNQVGIATSTPRYTLEVGPIGYAGTTLWVNGNTRVTGILTVGSSSIVLDGANNRINIGAGVTIDGNTGIISATSMVIGGSTLSSAGVTTTSTLNVGTGGTVITTTAAGLVGIGSTNPTYKLDVNGSVKVGIDTSAGVILTSPNGTKYQLFVENDGTLKTVTI